MTALKFKVNRVRPEDGQEQIVECVVPMESGRAKLISYEDAWDNEEACERAYNRFCKDVWRYVKDQHGLDTGIDWYFETSPQVIEL